MVLNAGPGLILGLLLGWDILAAILLAGVTWISSSGVVSKVLNDLQRLGNRETPAVLNLLVIEDLAMAVYLPLVAALIVGGTVASMVGNIATALVAVTLILLLALRFGKRLSAMLAGGSDEALLLGIFGFTLLVAGGAQLLEVSGAIGAFLVGLAISGPTEERAMRLVSPLRDLFAATFFVFFSFQIDPSDLVNVMLPAIGLVLVTALTKVAVGWYSAARMGIGRQGRLRAGTVLIARGEFSIVIAALGADLLNGPDLGALAAAYVLVSAVLGPLATKFYHLIPSSVSGPKPSRDHQVHHEGTRSEDRAQLTG